MMPPTNFGTISTDLSHAETILQVSIFNNSYKAEISQIFFSMEFDHHSSGSREVTTEKMLERSLHKMVLGFYLGGKIRWLPRDSFD